jgi:hypothetical protein
MRRVEQWIAAYILILFVVAWAQTSTFAQGANSKTRDNSALLKSLDLPILRSGIASPQAGAPPKGALGRLNGNPYDPHSLLNPLGAGNPYRPDGLMNPYSPFGSRYSNRSWTNPYAADAPKLYDSKGNYRGRLSTNRYHPESISNPSGRYGNPHSPESIRNPHGAGNPYINNPIYVFPAR